MNTIELVFLACCAAALLSVTHSSTIGDQRSVELSPEDIEQERDYLQNLREVPIIEYEPLAKRAQTFVRFGKRAQTFVRFGKRAQTFVRFGRSEPKQM
ncbi:hypothetical protein KIN20_031013 [Parelaphostrongylus tenuis]|uniref:Uncharacterized protein n=1 Tax=Parelaphostrongylus tenuis TaxID=148309 RepID=A0AAD5WGJ3_PARTN|nr:hypothetical protein KIN20_031013 [Parelaphostrongylus tenuis]